MKIVISSSLYVQKEGIGRLLSFLSNRRSGIFKLLLVHYIPVAILYAAYSNLMIVNLKFNNPTVYIVLSISRLLMTAVVWQVQFQVKISNNRKAALFLITVGIILMGMKELAAGRSDDVNEECAIMNFESYGGVEDVGDGAT